MKNYVSPVILDNDELAEGIYAASGDVPTGGDNGGNGGEGGAPAEVVKDYENDTDCWTVSVTKDQAVAHEGWATFRIQADHPGTVVHISTKSCVTIVFSAPITNAVFEGFSVSVNGCTVTTTRESHGNSYVSADQYNSVLKVWTEDPESLSVVGAPVITCTHAVNVQGGFD